MRVFIPSWKKGYLKTEMSCMTEVDGFKHSFQWRCCGPLLKKLHPPGSHLLYRLHFLRLQCSLFCFSILAVPLNVESCLRHDPLFFFLLVPFLQYYLMVPRFFFTSLDHIPGLQICISTASWTSLTRCL